MPSLEDVQVLVSILMSVGWSDKGKQLKLRHCDISGAHFQETATCVHLSAEDRQKNGEAKVGTLVKSMYGTQRASHTWQLDHPNVICGEHGGFPKRQTQCSIVLQCKLGCEGGSAR